jgi:hypothetical protein
LTIKECQDYQKHIIDICHWWSGKLLFISSTISNKFFQSIFYGGFVVAKIKGDRQVLTIEGIDNRVKNDLEGVISSEEMKMVSWERE